MGDMETPKRCLTKGWSPPTTNSAGTKVVPQYHFLQLWTNCNTYEQEGSGHAKGWGAGMGGPSRVAAV